MRNWSDSETQVIQKFKGLPFDQIFGGLPENEKRYKCHTCHYFFYEKDLLGTDKHCPVCGEVFNNLAPMCPLDHNSCHDEVIATIAYCPLCGKAVCPACGTHDVVQISRVTGYLQAVEGFNAAKKQELKDRTRYSTDGAVASIGISMS